jgi:hypothetical protein
MCSHYPSYRENDAPAQSVHVRTDDFYGEQIIWRTSAPHDSMRHPTPPKPSENTCVPKGHARQVTQSASTDISWRMPTQPFTARSLVVHRLLIDLRRTNRSVPMHGPRFHHNLLGRPGLCPFLIASEKALLNSCPETGSWSMKENLNHLPPLISLKCNWVYNATCEAWRLAASLQRQGLTSNTCVPAALVALADCQIRASHPRPQTLLSFGQFGQAAQQATSSTSGCLSQTATSRLMSRTPPSGSSSSRSRGCSVHYQRQCIVQHVRVESATQFFRLECDL